MSEQEASVTVAVGLAGIESCLRDVPSWSSFLIGVVDVVRIAHERYLFRLEDGRQVRVAVRAHLRDHRFTWHALAGPAFEGSLRLAAVDVNTTRLTLRFTARPAGFVANLAEMFARSRSRAALDLQLLDSFVHARAS